MRQTVILVKHARPQINPTQPAAQWALSEEGRHRCAALAGALARWQPEIIISSEELKAAQTAELTARHLDIRWRTSPNLHEHDRSNAPYLADEAAFQAQIAALFAHPDERMFGMESAHEALARFSHALDTALDVA
ncbi:MAG: histidine phosphatase family protein, partial [Ktedonobacterales bacterium]